MKKKGGYSTRFFPIPKTAGCQNSRIRRRIWLFGGFSKNWMRTSRSGKRQGLNALRQGKAAERQKETQMPKSRNNQNNQMIVLIVRILRRTNSRRHQPARPTESRNPTGSGLDAIRCSPYMASEFRGLREAGVEDALVVAALKEAMRHQAKYPWVYAKRLLDQAAAQKITTLEAWEKVHITYKGNRVDRETPSGNNFLGLDNSLNLLKRRPLKKRVEEVPPD